MQPIPARGSATIDFLVALVVVMTFAAIVLSFAYFQEEKIVDANMRMRAEEMAMQAGSAINRFIASGPEDGSYLNITINNATDMPMEGIFFDVIGCNYTVSSGNLTVSLAYLIKGTSAVRTVNAEYPILASLSFPVKDCGDYVNITVSGGAVNAQ